MKYLQKHAALKIYVIYNNPYKSHGKCNSFKMNIDENGI